MGCGASKGAVAAPAGPAGTAAAPGSGSEAPVGGEKFEVSPGSPRTAADDVKDATAPDATHGSDYLNLVFMQFDTDGSGDIDQKELKRALCAIGLKGDLDTFMKALDPSGRGKINWEGWVKNMPTEMRDAILSKLNDKNVVEGFRPLVGWMTRTSWKGSGCW